MNQTEALTHVTHVNAAIHASLMSQNFRLFHASNLSVLNFSIFSAHVSGVIGQSDPVASV